MIPIGTSLRPAAHGAVRPSRDGAGVVLHLQRPGRCRRPDRRHQASPGGLRLMAVSYEMYQEQILDHYKHPRNKGSLPGATKNARDTNPLCGDEVVLHLKVDGSDRIADVRFEGQGCAISQASASMLTTIVKGMSLGDATALDRDAILKKLGIPLSAVRLKCALLSLHVLKVALGRKPGCCSTRRRATRGSRSRCSEHPKVIK